MPDEMRYFLPSEVVLHNKPEDVWVSFQGKVYDMTNMVQQCKGKKIAKIVLRNAGKDITHCFDVKTKNVKKTAESRGGGGGGAGDRPKPPLPSIKWNPYDFMEEPEDKTCCIDKKYEIGYLTRKARPVRIINVLAPATHRNNLIWVACEESVGRIIDRIKPHNSHAASYTLKFEGRILHKMKTLAENDVPDERDKFMQLGLTDDFYVPAIKLYYNDDLTVR